jgi:multiple sugar transport system substrate-binding protein
VAAHVLLALAAPKAKHPSQLAVLFDLESMEPQIAGPPFVEALEELVGATSAGTGERASGQPAWQWWPPRDDAARIAAGQGVAAELPESGRVYYADGQTWERPSTGLSRAPLVGARSFIGSVTTASRNPPAAFRLLGWLAGRSERGGGRVSVVPYRRGTADELVERAFSQAAYLQVPRILEVESYLAALDASVRQAWQGELAPQDALGEAAQKWDEITDRVGRERQQKVYRDHLNLQ